MVSQGFRFRIYGIRLGFRGFLGLGFQVKGFTYFFWVQGFCFFRILQVQGLGLCVFLWFYRFRVQGLGIFLCFLGFSVYDLGLYRVQSLEFFRFRGFWVFQGFLGLSVSQSFLGFRVIFVFLIFRVYEFLGFRVQSLGFCSVVNVFQGLYQGLQNLGCLKGQGLEFLRVLGLGIRVLDWGVGFRAQCFFKFKVQVMDFIFVVRVWGFRVFGLRFFKVQNIRFRAVQGLKLRVFQVQGFLHFLGFLSVKCFLGLFRVQGLGIMVCLGLGFWVKGFTQVFRLQDFGFFRLVFFMVL